MRCVDRCWTPNSSLVLWTGRPGSRRGAAVMVVYFNRSKGEGVLFRSDGCRV
jgi:hypothetical protein